MRCWTGDALLVLLALAATGRACASPGATGALPAGLTAAAVEARIKAIFAPTNTPQSIQVSLFNCYEFYAVTHEATLSRRITIRSTAAWCAKTACRAGGPGATHTG
jgi:hypothetical protein